MTSRLMYLVVIGQSIRPILVSINELDNPRKRPFSECIPISRSLTQ